MPTLKLIVQLVLAIPEVYKIIMSLWDMLKAEQQKREDKARKEAFEAMKKATTSEEVKSENENITRNLP